MALFRLSMAYFSHPKRRWKMRKIMLFVLASFVISIAATRAYSDNQTEIAKLQKIIAECKDPLKVPAGIFKQIKLLQGVQPRIDTRTLTAAVGEGLVHVFVDSVIYHGIQFNLDQFLLDLQADGYTVALTKSWNQTPEQIRAILQSEYSSGLVGIVLVGDIPAAWMETSYFTDSYISYFPTDYFYMDLTGKWKDSDADGFYDTFKASLKPEIWSGRISPSTCLFGDEITLLNRYFVKNHAYRTGNLSLPDRALGYFELNWYPQMEDYMRGVYGDVTIYADENQTTAYHYKETLRQGYEWVHLLAHSSPWGSTFFLEGETYGGGSLFDHEIPPLNPQASFVLLNACSNAKYTETNNQGQTYLFGSDHVVAVIGETRIMYGDDFKDLYLGLSSGKNLGDSFLDWIWWNYEGFWGCHIFGDPTLKPHRHGNSTTSTGSVVQEIISTTIEEEGGPVNIAPFTDGNPSGGIDHQGNIWAAWNSGRDVRSNIWAAKFDGLSWSAPEEIAFSDLWDFHPSISADPSGNVWIFWQSYRNADYGYDGWDIYGIYNNGTSWSDPLRVTTAEPYDVEPKSAVDSTGKAWVVWRTERKPDSDIMYSYWNGSAWSSADYITSSEDEERDPSITVDKDGNVWVFWYARHDGNWDIYARYFNGSVWSSEERVTDDPGYDVQPVVTADNTGKVWLVWRSNRDGDMNIYTKYHLETNWSSEIAITTDPGADVDPSITCCGGDGILAVWQSNRDGNWNIYQSTYRNGWTSPSPVTTDAANQIDPVALSPAYDVTSTLYANDISGYWDIYQNTFSTLPLIVGDADMDGTKTLSDALYILNYLFKQGPAPVSLEAADFNRDRVVNLLDAINLIDHLFRKGDQPGH
jgi:hypothetical protein